MLDAVRERRRKTYKNRHLMDDPRRSARHYSATLWAAGGHTLLLGAVYKEITTTTGEAPPPSHRYIARGAHLNKTQCALSARLLGSKQRPRGNTGRPWTNKCSLKFAGNSCPASARPGAARGVAVAAGEGGTERKELLVQEEE